MLTRYLLSPPDADGDHSVVYLPRTWRPNASRRAVILAAGSGTAWPAAYSPTVLFEIARAITAAGFACATSELGAEQFSNANCRTRIGALRTLLGSAAIGAKIDKVHLAGFSMGGGSLAAWAGNNPTLVASYTGWAPLLNLTAQRNLGGANQTAIDAVYSGGYSEATYGAASNPQTMAAAGKYAGLPMTVCYSSTDGVVAPATATAFAATVGSNVTLVNLGDQVHANTLPNLPASIAALLARLASVPA